MPADARASSCPQPLEHVLPGSSVSSGDFVEVQRTRCYGTCPAYTVRLDASGAVRWHGAQFVAVTGEAQGQVDAGAAANLMQQLRDHGFAQLCGSYTRNITDSASTITTLSVGNTVKQVRDYAGSAPGWVREFDDRVDALANTHQWRHGDGLHELLSSNRLAEDALFAKPGRNLMMRAAATHDRGAIEVMLQQRVPVDAEDESGWTALMYAAGAGSIDQVRQLLAAGADATHRSHAGEPVMFAATGSPDNAVAKLRLLQRAGGNAQTSSNDGTTALMIAASHPAQSEVLGVLVEMGVNPAARNAQGKTALDLLNAADPTSATAAQFDAERTLLQRAR
jgi:hypothetical protein